VAPNQSRQQPSKALRLQYNNRDEGSSGFRVDLSSPPHYWLTAAGKCTRGIIFSDNDTVIPPVAQLNALRHQRRSSLTDFRVLDTPATGPLRCGRAQHQFASRLHSLCPTEHDDVLEMLHISDRTCLRIVYEEKLLTAWTSGPWLACWGDDWGGGNHIGAWLAGPDIGGRGEGGWHVGCERCRRALHDLWRRAGTGLDRT
jgi:hypothetical protein